MFFEIYLFYFSQLLRIPQKNCENLIPAAVNYILIGRLVKMELRNDNS